MNVSYTIYMEVHIDHTKECDKKFISLMREDKDVEGRKVKPGGSDYGGWTGQIVVWYDPCNPTNSLATKIKSVQWYASLEEYVSKEGVEHIFPHLCSEKEALEEYTKIPGYDSESIKKDGGIWALRLAVWLSF